MTEKPALETSRLVLRPWRESDAEALYAFAQDPGVAQLRGLPPHTSVENSLDAIRGALASPETYAIVLRQSAVVDMPVGSVGLMVGPTSDLGLPEDEAEVSCWIGRPFWGHGLMPEAVIAMIRHAFLDLGLAAVWCGWYEGNERGRHVQEGAGFLPHHVIEHRHRPAGGEGTEYVGRLTREQWEMGQASDPTDAGTVARQRRAGDAIMRRRQLVSYVRAGGQTGADRGGLDAARDCGVPICGWCPRGGLAEDMTEPPGLLRDYPELVETASDGYVDRTAWNVRDSHATLVVAPDGLEPLSGTAATVDFARDYGRPVMVVKGPGEASLARRWLAGVGTGLTLNVAGPRGSKLPQVYAMTKDVVSRILRGGEV